MGRITTAGAITELPIPKAGSYPYGIFRAEERATPGEDPAASSTTWPGRSESPTATLQHLLASGRRYYSRSPAATTMST